MDRKRVTTHLVAVAAGAALVLMLGAGQPSGKVCVGVAAVYQPGPHSGEANSTENIYFVRAFADGTVEYFERDEHGTRWLDSAGNRLWRPLP